MIAKEHPKLPKRAKEHTEGSPVQNNKFVMPKWLPIGCFWESHLIQSPFKCFQKQIYKPIANKCWNYARTKSKMEPTAMPHLT